MPLRVATTFMPAAKGSALTPLGQKVLFYCRVNRDLRYVFTCRGNGGMYPKQFRSTCSQCCFTFIGRLTIPNHTWVRFPLAYTLFVFILKFKLLTCSSMGVVYLYYASHRWGSSHRCSSKRNPICLRFILFHKFLVT